MKAVKGEKDFQASQLLYAAINIFVSFVWENSLSNWEVALSFTSEGLNTDTGCIVMLNIAHGRKKLRLKV